MYEIIFTDTAKKQLKKLDHSVQERILNSFDRIRIRPERFIKRLVGNPYYILRVGDFRVILDVERDRLVIFVIEVGHRSTVYKDGQRNSYK